MAARRIDRAMNTTNTARAVVRIPAVRRNAQQDESDEDREKRFRIIRACLVDFTKKVDVGNFLKAEGEDLANDLAAYKMIDAFDEDENQSEDKYLVIPGAGVNKYGMMVGMTPNKEKDKDNSNAEVDEENPITVERSNDLPLEQTVRIDCAVCLGHFEPGQNIIWSSNPICQHAFHEECILRWLTRVARNTKRACPCCRADFITNEYWEELHMMDKGGEDGEVNLEPSVPEESEIEV